MKLITHNLLMCNKKGCNSANSYPLKVAVQSWEYYNEESVMTYKKQLI